MSDQHPAEALDLLYVAAQSGDLATLKALIADDAYVLTDAPDGERRGRERVARALIDTFEDGVPAGANRQIERSISASTSGRTAWAFEQVELERVVGGATELLPFRFMLLLTRPATAGAWRPDTGRARSPMRRRTP